jgi:hypothetical protein
MQSSKRWYFGSFGSSSRATNHIDFTSVSIFKRVDFFCFFGQRQAEEEGLMRTLNDTKSAALCAQNWDSCGERNDYREQCDEAKNLHCDDGR